MTVHGLLEDYRAGRTTPAKVVAALYEQIQPGPVWIHIIPQQEAIQRAEALGPFRKDLPLYGIPFAIKDNIDLAAVPTTAACPQFAYTPAASADVVERLLAAGAIPIGKTNMDQFATGLVGTRSPYGACSSVADLRYISGGSSSGSAVAVASGLVAFSLGTDTAGSGRVPAAFNGIVGFKPTRGAISTQGVVPACKTLDCVSIFTHTREDAWRVFQVARSSKPVQTKAWTTSGYRVGVVPGLGDLYEAAVENLGGERVEIDFRPFQQAGDLLYSGPWVAERLAAIKDFATAHPDALHPITAKIILGANRFTAVDTFEAMYRLSELADQVRHEWERMDFLVLPTATDCYTHDEIAADPIGLNTKLGSFTNFVNLLDLAAVAIPAGTRPNGIPYGVTLIAPAGSDQALLGAETYCPEGYVPLAVCGAHLTGQPLNHQLTQAGAFLIEATRTSPEYRFYALRGTVPAKPGLFLDPQGGAAIEVEVWAVPVTRFGAFVAAVPSPLVIGTCRLESGRFVKSFLCEPWALADAYEITALGAWRKYLAMKG